MLSGLDTIAEEASQPVVPGQPPRAVHFAPVSPAPPSNSPRGPDDPIPEVPPITLQEVCTSSFDIISISDLDDTKETSFD